jgi:hypothetical protein
MASFQSTLLIIATVILIIILVLFAFSLNAQKKNQKWPPINSECPDYWVDASGNGAKCINTLHLGTCGDTAPDFTQSPYTGVGGTCKKYQWASTCGVSWDGITYGYGQNMPCVPKSA